MKKVTKDNLRIMSKQYAHLQTMTLTPVKFQSNQSKPVGGVPYTRYLLLEGGRTGGWNAKYYVPSIFFEKAGDNKVLRG